MWSIENSSINTFIKWIFRDTHSTDAKSCAKSDYTTCIKSKPLLEEGKLFAGYDFSGKGS